MDDCRTGLAADPAMTKLLVRQAQALSRMGAGTPHNMDCPPS